MRTPATLVALAAASLLSIAAIPAHAEPQLGLGLVNSAQSTQFQADLDLTHHFGFQAATGRSSQTGEFSGSAGGRLYLFGYHVQPYVGVLYNLQSVATQDAAGNKIHEIHSAYAGPTVGLRVKMHHGLGAFAEVEYLGQPEPTDPANKKPVPTVGAGIQWYF